MNSQRGRWGFSEQSDQYGSSSPKDRSDQSAYGGSATYGMTGDRRSDRFSSISPSEYQKQQESFGNLGSYGSNWDSNSSKNYSSFGQYPSTGSGKYDQDAKGQFSQSRASDRNQESRGLKDDNISDKDSRAQFSFSSDMSQESESLVHKMKDKVGDVVEKVEDLASSAWDKISGSSKDPSSGKIPQ